MPKKLQAWQKRVRSHIRDRKLSGAQIAETLEVEEATVRHWLNGTRRIKLDDFLRLCSAVEFDPAIALFGRPVLSDKLHAVLQEHSIPPPAPHKFPVKRADSPRPPPAPKP